VFVVRYVAGDSGGTVDFHLVSPLLLSVQAPKLEEPTASRLGLETTLGMNYLNGIRKTDSETLVVNFCAGSNHCPTYEPQCPIYKKIVGISGDIGRNCQFP
jgi:hypothetical protein